MRPDVGRPQPGQTGDGIRHAVHGELRPALAPQVRGERGRRGVAHDAHDLAGAVGVAAVVLADLEPHAAGIGPHGVTGLVHAGTDQDHAAQRVVLPRYARHALVVDPVLEIDHDATVRIEMTHA